MEKSNKMLIPAVYVLLVVFNVVYWPGKFVTSSFPMAAVFYNKIGEHWGLIMFLEFLAIASIFVDLVVRWDEFIGTPKKLRMMITALLFAAFVLQYLLGMIDIFMVGETQ